MPYDWVAKDGFEFAYDRFCTVGGRIERVELHILRDMFLPKLTREAKRRLNESLKFVPSQLKHYGVNYDEGELTGNGTRLLQKMLREGKLGKVPNHIEELRSQLATQWYDQLTLEEMADTHQKELIEKYFLDNSGLPDRSKTTDVLTVPLPPGSTYRTGMLVTAAKSVDGLHHIRCGDSLYIGWDLDAVENSASGHWDRVERAEKQAKMERDQERDAKNAAYLREARKMNGEGGWSPVGTYIIDCDEIESQWPDYADHKMTLHIVCPPGVHGCFKARFDFGVIEGMMILSDQESTLDEYCTQLEHKNTPSNSKYLDDEEQDDRDQPATGSKRKAASRDEAPRKRKKDQGKQSKTLFLKWKGKETETGMVLYEANGGSIAFNDAEYSKFTGKMDMGFIGRNVPFLARKVSGRGRPCGSWCDYSESAYEEARVSRWR